MCTIASGPVFAGLLALARTRRSPPRSWLAGTTLSIIGVVLLVGVGRDSGSVEAIGIVAALVAGFGYACYASVAKVQMERGLDAPASMASLFLTAGVLTSPLLAFEPMEWLSTGSGAVMIVHLGVVTVGVAYTCYGYGLRRLATPTVVTLTLVEPVTAALLSVVVLGEAITPRGGSASSSCSPGSLSPRARRRGAPARRTGRGRRDVAT